MGKGQGVHRRQWHEIVVRGQCAMWRALDRTHGICGPHCLLAGTDGLQLSGKGRAPGRNCSRNITHGEKADHALLALRP